MQNNKRIHPLAADNTPSGMIRFIHSDDKEYTYYSCINSLTGERMSGHDKCLSIGHSVSEIKKIFKNIRKRCKVLEEFGDF